MSRSLPVESWRSYVEQGAVSRDPAGWDRSLCDERGCEKVAVITGNEHQAHLVTLLLGRDGTNVMTQGFLVLYFF